MTPVERTTRQRVLRSIAERGPITVACVAEVVGVTAAAVRRHLDALTADQLISCRPVVSRSTRGRGRPAREYLLTDAGHAAMTTAYDDLATSALTFLAEEVGEDAVVRFADSRVADLERRYAPMIEAAGPDISDRITALATALSGDGYAASTRSVAADTTPATRSGGQTTPPTRPVVTQLCQGHCPVQHVAARFPQLCDAETEAFSRLLGVHVQRLATLAHGEHVCTTHIPLASGQTHVPLASGQTHIPLTSGQQPPTRVTVTADGRTA